jgi:single-stranded-DNA-specific exonuclease
VIIKIIFNKEIYKMLWKNRQSFINMPNTLANTGILPHIQDALLARGVVDPKEALMQYSLLNYKDLKGLDEILPILSTAIDKQEKIIVVADYDCDGATACVVAVDGLKKLGANIDFVVPNRFIHGYGLTPSVVESILPQNPRWLLTVDNGIASNSGVDFANKNNIGVLITDHHLPGDSIPLASAIVNPNQPNCNFGSKNLAGCGVMYYVLGALKHYRQKMGCIKANNLNILELLDVVALGTVADVVKLDKNNRWLVNEGLKRIRSGLVRPGIKALFDISNKQIQYAKASDFGFAVGPRINAAGRLLDMTVGIRCLLSSSLSEATNWAIQLHDLNASRKQLELEMKQEAFSEIDISGQEGKFTRVVYNENFHEGVIGIVAGRIKETAHVPTLVFAPAHNEPNLIKASGRSIVGIHLRDVLDLVHKRGNNLFIKFGGHAMAAGLTMEKNNLQKFIDLFEKAVAEWCENKLPHKELLHDGDLNVENINIETAYAVSSMVWGQGFEEPIWIGSFRVAESRLVGKDKNHLKLKLEKNNLFFDAMQFFCEEELTENTIVDIAYQIDWNEFMGEHKITLRVVDRY